MQCRDGFALVSRTVRLAFVSSAPISLVAATANSSMARLKAASFACDGLAKPLILRVNWIAAARISSSVAGGSKLNSGRMLRHMGGVPFGCRSKHERCDQVKAGPCVPAAAPLEQKENDKGGRRWLDM
jgi:hypothetical protein